MKSTVDVQEIMREVRKVVRAENRKRDDLLREARRTIPGRLPATISRLKLSTAALEELARKLGDIPPAPPTTRARLGASIIQVMHRALFWLLPSLRTIEVATAQAMREHVAATEDLLRALNETNIRLEQLRRLVERDGIAGCESQS
jgi:hypothetical protein